MARAVVMGRTDNVATVLADVALGQEVEVVDETGRSRGGVQAIDDIPFGHKIALRHVDEDRQVVKYGHTIGTATAVIRVGQHVDTHNLGSVRGRVERASQR